MADWPALNRKPTHREVPVACTCGQPTLADILAAIKLLHVPLNRLEIAMANESEQFSAFSGRFDAFVSDVRAELARLNAERDNLGADGQAALDALNAKLDAAHAEVGDADGSDQPQPTDPNA